MQRRGAAPPRTIALILVLLAAREVRGAEPPGYLAVRSYGAESGIGNPDATHTLQDGEGFLWLSTLDGLYRFDGERFERFGLESGLPSVELLSMAVDAQGQLLVLTQHGLSRWSGERFAAVPTPGAPAALLNFLVDAQGALLLASKQGLYQQTAPGGPYALAPGWPGGPALALWLEPSGELLVGSGTRLLRRDTQGRWHAEEVPLASSELAFIARDGQGRLWLQGDGWLASRTGEGAPFEDRMLNPADAPRTWARMRLGKRGQVLVPGRRGVVEIEQGQARVLPMRLSERELSLADVIEDREGALWIASLGVHRAVARGLWTTHDTTTGLPSDVIWGLARGPDNTLWVGTDKGLAWATSEGWRTVPGLGGHVLRAVEVEPGGAVWAAGTPPGLHRYEPRTGVLRTFGERDGIAEGNVYALLLEPEGTVWLGGSQGLVHGERVGGDWKFTTVLPPNPRMPIVGVTRDGAGRLWATGDGLFVREEGGTFRRFGAREGLREDRLRYVLARRDGRICVAYVEPLGTSCFRYHDGRLTEELYLTHGAGLSNGTVYQLGEDAAGRLWVGSGAGVDIIAPGWSDYFGVNTGLPGNDTNGNSFLAEADGTVWVGTSMGLGRFEGARYSGPLAPPEVRLLELSLGPHLLRHAPDQPLQVAHDASTLEVRFTSPRFHDAERLEYSVRLAGLDDWRPSTARAARYTTIPPGHYRFEARARIRGQPWGPVTGFQVEVRPPWWLTGWGMSLGAALLAGLVVGGGRGWAATLRRRNAELEVLVRSRTAELTQAREQIAQAEKLSAMGQLLARLSHEINNPLTAIHNNLPPVSEYVQTLAGALRDCREWLREHPEHAERLERLWREQQLDYVLGDLPEALDSMRTATERIRSIQADLRAFLRGERPPLVPDDVEAVVRDTVELVRRTLPPGVRLEYPGGALPQARVHRGQVAQVLHNLLRNAVDAVSPAGQVRLTTAVRDDCVELRVADSGPGVPAELRQRIFEPFFTTKDVGQGSGLGLAICRQIIEEHHGGTLALDETVERGACFVVRLPLARVR